MYDKSVPLQSDQASNSVSYRVRQFQSRDKPPAPVPAPRAHVPAPRTQPPLPEGWKYNKFGQIIEVTTGNIWTGRTQPSKSGKLPPKHEDYDITWHPDLNNWMYLNEAKYTYMMFDINQHS